MVAEKGHQQPNWIYAAAAISYLQKYKAEAASSGIP